jgi:cytochrome c5
LKTFSLALLCLISLTAQAEAPARTGAQIFQTYCTNCHAGGWQGAPVANDKAEWADRLANG